MSPSAYQQRAERLTARPNRLECVYKLNRIKMGRSSSTADCLLHTEIRLVYCIISMYVFSQECVCECYLCFIAPRGKKRNKTLNLEPWLSAVVVVNLV